MWRLLPWQESCSKSPASGGLAPANRATLSPQCDQLPLKNSLLPQSFVIESMVEACSSRLRVDAGDALRRLSSSLPNKFSYGYADSDSLKRIRLLRFGRVTAACTELTAFIPRTSVRRYRREAMQTHHLMTMAGVRSGWSVAESNGVAIGGCPWQCATVSLIDWWVCVAVRHSVAHRLVDVHGSAPQCRSSIGGCPWQCATVSLID
eukprot:1179749-Prorocentrum_minimum.AAC.5